MIYSVPWSAPPVPIDASAQISTLQTQLQLLHSEEKRLVLLLRAMEQLHHSAPLFVLDLCDQAFRIATVLRDSKAIAHILYYRGLCRRQLGAAGAAADLAEAYEAYSSHDMPVAAALAAYEAGRGEIAAGRHKEGLQWLVSALELCDSADIPVADPRNEMSGIRTALLATLGGLHADIGDYPRAISYYLQVLANSKSKGDDNATGVALSELGVLYGHLEDYDAAFDSFERSVALFRATGNRYLEVKALTNLGNIHYWRGELDQALEYAMTGLIVYEVINDISGTATTLIMVGNIYESQGDFNVALDYQLQAWATLENLPPSPLHIAALLGIGRLYRAIGRNNDARDAMEQALTMAGEDGDRSLRYQAHYALSIIWEDLGDLTRALRHHRRYAELRNELLSEEKGRELRDLHVQYEVEKAEHDRDRYKGRVEQVERELREKQGEITALTLALVEKTEFIEAVRREIGEVERHADSSTRGMIAGLLTVVKGGGAEAPDNWAAFEAQFQQLHRDFIQVISKRYPELTPTELKICALLRLNLPSKEVALMLHMSARTVESHRYWIRKKLGLAERVNLKSFLSGI